MAKFIQKQKAIELRKSGLSIREIASRVVASPSAISLWCRDIILSPTQRSRIEISRITKAVAAFQKHNEQMRAERIRKTTELQRVGAEMVGKVSKRDLLIAGLSLYWAEGYKKGSDEFGFTNSDPLAIALIIKWLDEIFSIGKNRLIFRISINEQHLHRIKKVEIFWSKKFSVPLTQFTKTSLIKTRARKMYENHEEYFGTLRVKVRNGTDLRRQILGAIEQLKISVEENS